MLLSTPVMIIRDLVEQTIVTPLRHRLKLFLPTIARARSRTDIQLAALGVDFDFIAQPNLIDKRFRETNTARVANLDEASFYAVPRSPARSPYSSERSPGSRRLSASLSN
jgi:hypothetical protein